MLLLFNQLHLSFPAYNHNFIFCYLVCVHHYVFIISIITIIIIISRIIELNYRLHIVAPSSRLVIFRPVYQLMQIQYLSFKKHKDSK